MRNHEDIQKARDLLLQVVLRQTPIILKDDDQYKVMQGQVDVLTWVLDNGEAPGQTFKNNLTTVREILKKMGYIEMIKPKDPRQN